MTDTPPPMAAAPPADEPSPDELAELVLDAATTLVTVAETTLQLSKISTTLAWQLEAQAQLDQAQACLEYVYDLADAAAEGGAR